MSRYTPALVTLALLMASAPSVSDGVFLLPAGYPASGDPRSHAPDITEPQQKALIVHNDGVEELVLQVSFKGSASDFAWVIPTPSRPKVYPVYDPVFHWLRGVTDAGTAYWFGANRIRWPYDTIGGARQAAGGGHLDVEVLHEDTVGVYDVSVLRSSSAEDLFAWLRNRKYQVPESLIPLAADYIRRGWVFTAVRVSNSRQAAATPKLQEGVLQSLKLVFSAREPIYPLKISSLNSGKTGVLLYVVAPSWVSAPGMGTDCRVEYSAQLSGASSRWYSNSGRYRVWNRDSYFTIPPGRLTKLRAEFTPEQMTDDIVLRADDALEQKDPAPSPAPLAANVGVLASLLVVYTVFCPYNAFLFAGLNLLALTRSGSKSMRNWLRFAVWWLVVTTPFSLILIQIGLRPRGADHLGVYAGIGQFAIDAAGYMAALVAAYFVLRCLYRAAVQRRAQIGAGRAP